MSPRERLEFLKSDEFDFALPPASSPRRLREYLRDTEHVQQLKSELGNGQLPHETVRRFVADLVGTLLPGRRFEAETALAALAVTLEDNFSDFAEEFLLGLARLRVAELAMATRVARMCLADRCTRNKTKVFGNRYALGQGFEPETAGWMNDPFPVRYRNPRPTVYA